MLEVLIKGNGNIYELNLEGVFLGPKQYRPRELYETLKESALYDKERGQWNWYMTKGQELKNTDRYSYEQLLGVWVEAQLNPQSAQRFYEDLKRTPLYDTESGQWGYRMNEKQELESSSRYANVELFAVLMEAQFNLSAAKGRYEALKETSLYDTKHGEWISCMNEEQESGDSNLYAALQLLGVLVEAQFNPDAARKRYEALKETSLYDAKYGQWNQFINKERGQKNLNRYAYAQLLGVLVEAEFNPEAAHKQYEALKDNTPLYDTERGQWNNYMNEGQELKDTDRDASAQLLAVLVEAKLLSLLHRSITRTIPPLPTITEF